MPLIKGKSIKAIVSAVSSGIFSISLDDENINVNVNKKRNIIIIFFIFISL